MNTLIYTSALAIVCMLAEMLNLRRFIWPIAIAGLLLILGINIGIFSAMMGGQTSLNLGGLVISNWGTERADYYNMISTTKFSVAFSGLITLLGLFIIILSGNFYKGEETKISDYLSIIIFTLCGGMAMVSFGNLAMFFLGLEVLSISLYILAGSKRKDLKSNEAGMKYFLMGSFASGILLFGVALIYGAAGSFDMERIGTYAIQSGVSSVLFMVGVGMVMIALMFKVSAVPFHFWAPDVYEGSPTLITALMATVAKIAAFAAFYRLFSFFMPALPFYAWILSAVAALTITVGNFSALNQDSFKRMLAFSGISHAGYLMMGILSMHGKTDNAVFFYSLAYGISSIGAFAVAIMVAQNVGSDKIEAFNGLGKRKPLLSAALTIAMLSMAGIPPFAGFFGKYYIFSEAVRNGHLLLTVLAVINSIIGIYYYMKVIIAMYTKDSDEVVFTVNPAYGAVIFITVVLSLLLGIMPSFFTHLL
jgi:NADH-quinone oxidoreductase subunit N